MVSLLRRRGREGDYYKAAFELSGDERREAMAVVQMFTELLRVLQKRHIAYFCSGAVGAGRCLHDLRSCWG